MRLTDVMGAAGLSGWAEAALLLFVAVFVTIAIHTFSRRRSAQYERARHLPLDDDLPAVAPAGPGRGDDR
ncbi:MAG: cbb3-type cytochrome c oxidase subunit 3 [Acidobacteria bacterium]|nr:MAG: cbb3-type cytochrome c oxidase subunit 3 [Acidobacteriota bacterium]